MKRKSKELSDEPREPQSRRESKKLLEASKELQSRGKIKEAMAKYREFFDRFYRNFGIENLCNLARLCVHFNDMEGAVGYYLMAVNILMKDGHYHRAASILEIVFAIKPNCQEAYEALISINRKLGRIDDLKEYELKLLKLKRRDKGLKPAKISAGKKKSQK
ncbi:MAG: hypothetical protein NTZ49_05935 [Candidatus Parcubacteria bacterium]|nr:hypothetical protein [Candidatus Parcubacteria bacterium]